MHRRPPRCFRPLGEEYDRLEPGVHDALILVHPDFSPRCASAEYLRQIRLALDAAARWAIPVFHVDGDCGDEDAPHPVGTWLREIGAAAAPEVGSTWRYVADRWMRRRRQREIDGMAGRFGKPPSRARIAFGGMYGHACVLGYADGWCGEIRVKPLEYPFQPSWPLRPRRPFRTGDILTRLCVF